MPFTITARFLLHTYQGADTTGKPERYPSPERLYKALVSTAYGAFGFNSKYAKQESRVSDQQLEAVFRWLETNPPDAIRAPRMSRRNGSDAIVYRDRGSRSKKIAADKKNVSAVCSTAYPDTNEGTLIWQWKQEPDADIADLLSRLCWEVPYLGEACSPVNLTTTNVPDDEFPVDPDNSLYKSDDDLSAARMAATVEFDVPDIGHLQELQRGYEQVYPRKVSASNGSEEEKTVLSNTLTDCVRSIGYQRKQGWIASSEMRPWQHGFFIPAAVAATKSSATVDDEHDVAWNPDESTFVAWSVALHRLLVRQWGYGASPLLTGRYEKGSTVPRPANNVAIQVLTAGMPVRDDELRECLPGFLVMVPHDMPVDEIDHLADVCDTLRKQQLFYARQSETLCLGEAMEVDLDTFWQPVKSVYRRLWTPYPLCIKETRKFRSRTDSNRLWNVQDSMALAIAYVWREYFTHRQDDADTDEAVNSPSVSIRESRYWSMADCVNNPESGVHIYDAHDETRTPMTDYVHKTQPGNLLMGMTALLSFDKQQWPIEQSAIAIGQSRHLGGGFLVPVDVYTQLIDKNGKPVWLR